MISGFCQGANEFFVLLGFYAAQMSSSAVSEQLSVHTSTVKHSKLGR
jgi:hypothetical protein